MCATSPRIVTTLDVAGLAVRQSAANKAACYFSGMKKPKKQKAKKRQPPQKRADVAASLAPSPTPPSFRGSFLLWFSAVAAAFTLFSGLQVVLDIADWARWLVEHWRGWTFGFWKRIGDYFGLQTYPQSAALLTFMSCIIPHSQQCDWRRVPRAARKPSGRM
jgi:hypothetical protein